MIVILPSLQERRCYGYRGTQKLAGTLGVKWLAAPCERRFCSSYLASNALERVHYPLSSLHVRCENWLIITPAFTDFRKAEFLFYSKVTEIDPPTLFTLPLNVTYCNTDLYCYVFRCHWSSQSCG